MPLPPSRIESLITRVTLTLILFFGVVSVAAIGLVIQHGSAAEQWARLAVPVAVIASSLLALALARRGRARIGALVIVVSVFGALVNYVVVGGYGLHSYSLAMLTLLIIVTSLLVGPRAGLAAAAVGVATVVTLYTLEQRGMVVQAGALRAIPLLNILVVYAILYCAAAGVLYIFAKAFRDSLRATEEQERRFRELLEAAPLGYVMHRHGRILLANRIAATSNGYAGPDALLGRPILDLLQEEDREAGEARLAAAAALPEGGRLPAIELRQRDARGRERRIEAVTLRVELADGPALLTQLRDVTEERAAAAALAGALAQAAAASRAKSDFVANISHEIRTPLNAIVGLSQLADDPALDGAARGEYLARVRAASQSLLEIISDVLDVSKIEAGALSLEDTDFDLRRELETVRRVHRDLAAEKGLAFVVTVDEQVPGVLRGDPLRLRQVISNFLSNAIKFTAEGRVELAVTVPRRDWLRVEVRDSGIGVAPQLRERLFQPFVQADTSTTRRFGGTGLGLSLTRRLVALMGGSVGVDARPGGGSVFWAELPAAEGDRAGIATVSREPVAAGDDRLRGARVLLVEDNEVNRVVAVAALTKLGVAVTTANDGHEALRCVADSAARPFAAVLMDIQMPGMDGYAAAEALRRDHPPDELPIIAMTAAAFAEDRERCYAFGMNDFIAKPFELSRLEAVLRHWIAARSAAGR